MIGISSIVDVFIDRPVKIYALVVGLTKVDPRAYGGWDGDCPGCDLDANNMARLLTDRKIPTVKLSNAEATSHRVEAELSKILSKCEKNDLAIFYISGHGGQVPDQNGDEIDGKDETLCLWDGQLIDDKLADIWGGSPEGIRAFYISDTCNSGTNFRSMPNLSPRIEPRKFKGQLIHYGGCADSNFSYGGGAGGVFTTALMSTYNPYLNYKQWFDAAKKLMPRNQIPIYAEYGEVTDTFRNKPIFN